LVAGLQISQPGGLDRDGSESFCLLGQIKEKCVAYWAFLTGRKVIYFGRKGESHLEDFPRAIS
jgi:hypothetical protein